MSSLFSIPEEVFHNNVFPMLRVNTLLCLRRVCRRSKYLSDDYLRVHPRSQSTVVISVPIDEDEEVNENIADIISLKSFLQREEKLEKSAARINTDFPIRIPCSRFWFIFESRTSISPHLISKFVARYGSQIKHLRVSDMNLPMSKCEENVYKQLPNLKHLTVSTLHDSDSDVEDMEPLGFPSVFSNLHSLKIRAVNDTNFVWELIKFAKNVRCLGVSVQSGNELEKLEEILNEKRHKNLQLLDAQSFPDLYSHPHLRPPVLEFFGKCNLKLVSVDCELLASESESFRLAPSASRIVSLDNYHVSPAQLDVYQIKTLPNVESIVANAYAKRSWKRALRDGRLQRIRNNLSPAVFPNLRKLDFKIYGSYAVSLMLSRTWVCFPNLKELILRGKSTSIGDVAFLGVYGERPFLQLRQLKKLDLGEINPGRGDPFSNCSFMHVFRHMRLQEFRMTSLEPLTDITGSGILSLLTGPFRDSIEIFPFEGWSLKNTTKKKFLELAEQFPCNNHIAKGSKDAAKYLQMFSHVFWADCSGVDTTCSLHAVK